MRPKILKIYYLFFIHIKQKHIFEQDTTETNSKSVNTFNLFYTREGQSHVLGLEILDIYE